jgi:ribosomal protein S12 methylthiotransferase accessory factor
MKNEIVEIGFAGGKRIDAKIGNFTIATDQSVKYGGEASAPEPFDLFLASIATCAGIFAWNFCETRRIETDGLAMRMVCSRDPVKKRFSKMAIQVTLPEGFPEKYRNGIIRAMELCAVKRHITEAPEFVIEVQS